MHSVWKPLPQVVSTEKTVFESVGPKITVTKALSKQCKHLNFDIVDVMCSHLKLALNLKVRNQKFQALGADVDARVKKDTKNALLLAQIEGLGSFFKAQKALEEFSKKDLEGASDLEKGYQTLNFGVVENLLSQSDLADAVKVHVNLVLKTLKDELDILEGIVGTYMSESWSEGLSAEATFPEVVAKADETIGKVRCKPLKGSVDDLQKAR